MADKGKAFTEKEAEKAVRWFKRAAGIEDWRIEVWVQDDPPRWAADYASTADVAGFYAAQVREKYAKIWVGPKACREGRRDPLMALFHECVHIWVLDIGCNDTDGKQKEFAWSRMAEICVAAYLGGVKVKR